MRAAAPVQLPSRFRRRLTIMFILSTAISSGILGLGTYGAVREQRYAASEDRAKQSLGLMLDLTSGRTSASELDQAIASTRARDGIVTLVVAADGARSSADSITAADVPPSITALDGTDPVSARTEVNGIHYIVTGGLVPNSAYGARMYAFISEQQIEDSMREVRYSLVFGWVALVGLSALVGSTVARRTLRPIQQASGAARALAEGLLDTRLPDASRDEFGAWARYFNEMAGELQAKIDELQQAHQREKRFTADVVHDLRTPLGGMVASASLLEDELASIPEPARKSAERVIQDVTRLRNLVGELLELTRLDNEHQELVIEPVELNALIVDIIELYRLQDFVTVGDYTHIVHTDRSRLRRVLSNIIDNAVKHGSETVTVRIDVDGHDVCIDVSDTGPGVPEPEKKAIFGRFYKVASSRSDGGTGLGLSIAATQMALLGGSVEVFDVEPHGARFRIRVPDNAGDALD